MSIKLTDEQMFEIVNRLRVQHGYTPLPPRSRKEPVKSNPTPSTGLGDTVKKICDATGVTKVVEKVMGKDCGCKKRQETLNKLVPYETNNPT